MLLSSFFQFNDQFIGIGRFWISIEKLQGFLFKILNLPTA